MFKLCLEVANNPDLNPFELAPGWDLVEIPAAKGTLPMSPEEDWLIQKQKLLSYHLPPMHASLDWCKWNPCAKTVDWEFFEFWTRRALRRLGEVGVTIIGVYGGFYKKVEDYSSTRQMDQAIQYTNLLGDVARQQGMMIVLEPMADPKSLWPTYRDGINFCRRIDHPNVRLMADLAYFLAINQPFEDIALEPDWCLHCHIAGEGGQPGYGNRVEIHKALFRVFRDIHYEGAVSAACPWKSTDGGPLDYCKETARSLEYLKNLRDEVYAE
jgi:sugar phosphate isomerase/epimerase